MNLDQLEHEHVDSGVEHPGFYFHLHLRHFLAVSSNKTRVHESKSECTLNDSVRLHRSILIQC